MASQTTLNRPPRAADADPAPGRHSKGFAHDAIELCELQFALFNADLRQALKAGRTGGVLVLVAGACLFAAAPVLLIALGALIEQTTELSRAASMLIAGLSGAAVGFAALVTGWNIARHGAAALNRSRSECQRNIAWLKEMLAKKPACTE